MMCVNDVLSSLGGVCLYRIGDLQKHDLDALKKAVE